MEINVRAFQDAIADENFVVKTTSVKPAGLAKEGLSTALAPLFAAVDGALEEGKLIHSELVIESTEPTRIAIETGVINLPFADAKKVSNFLDQAGEAELKLYLTVAAPALNASHFRIDLLATVEEYLKQKQAIQDVAIAEIQEKLDLIEANEKAPKPEPVEAEKKSTTKTAAAKKVPSKKTAAKKSTTKKTAKKKTTAKKTAAKKTAVKKATK